MLYPLNLMYANVRDITGEGWMNQDPSTISATQIRVCRLFESLLCPPFSNHLEDCKCMALKDIYGPRPFKCTRFGCQFFRKGYEHAKERNSHTQTHDRPYRCDRPGCEFGQIGFSSSTRLNLHLAHHDEKHRLADQVPPEKEEDHDDDSARRILRDAVRTDNFDAVWSLSTKVPKFAGDLMREAVELGSCAMLEFLLDACPNLDVMNFGVLHRAVEINNLETTQILLDRESRNARSCMGVAMRNRSPDMIKTLLVFDSDNGDNSRDRSDWGFYTVRELLGDKASPERDAEVITCLGLLKTWSRRSYLLECVFTTNALLNCSIPVAKYLLQIGVDINTKGHSTIKPVHSALWTASLKTSEIAARFMKFLLESGAHTTTPPGKKKALSDRPGPKNISKWFGISWEQLVEESRKKYLESKGEIESGVHLDSVST